MPGGGPTPGGGMNGGLPGGPGGACCCGGPLRSTDGQCTDRLVDQGSSQTRHATAKGQAGAARCLPPAHRAPGRPRVAQALLGGGSARARRLHGSVVRVRLALLHACPLHSLQWPSGRATRRGRAGGGGGGRRRRLAAAGVGGLPGPCWVPGRGADAIQVLRSRAWRAVGVCSRLRAAPAVGQAPGAGGGAQPSSPIDGGDAVRRPGRSDASLERARCTATWPSPPHEAWGPALHRPLSVPICKGSCNHGRCRGRRARDCGENHSPA